MVVVFETLTIRPRAVFTTSNGRAVKTAGGIAPDVEVRTFFFLLLVVVVVFSASSDI